MPVTMLGSVLLVMVQVVGMVSLFVLSLLRVLHLVLNTMVVEVLAWSLRGAMVHGLPFVAFIILQRDKGSSLVVVPMVVFVAVALIGVMIRFALTPLWRKWLGIGFTLLILSQC
jgi:hypothetical protein